MTTTPTTTVFPSPYDLLRAMRYASHKTGDEKLLKETLRLTDLLWDLLEGEGVADEPQDIPAHL